LLSEISQDPQSSGIQEKLPVPTNKPKMAMATLLLVLSLLSLVTA
jgi:hypothetical protein